MKENLDTEKDFIEYFINEYSCYRVIDIESLEPDMMPFFFHIDRIRDLDVENWIIKRANIMIKLGYLESKVNGQSWDTIPEVFRPIINMEIEVDPRKKHAILKIPLLIGSIKVSTVDLFNIFGCQQKTIARIKQKMQESVDSLMASLGKALTVQDEVEALINKWGLQE